ncbi:MAG TPA: CAP domain-containing protein [Acidimicrobiales bacterium]|nr:CAP domain-containing protein [Acidimicrobiales bacterium]
MPSGGGDGGRATGRRARRAAWSAIVAALCGALVAAASPARAQVPDVEAAFVARIGAERAAAGRSPLSVADDLVAVARRHSATMAAEKRLYHNPALGSQVVNWVKVGENVGTGGTVDNIHAALMASSTHRDEILGAAFTEVGVGVATADGALWVTQVFRLPETAAAAAPPTPSPAPAAVPPPPPPPPTTVARPATPARAAATPAAAAARTAASRSAPAAAAVTVPPSTAPPTSAPAAAVAPTLAPPPGLASPPSIALAPVPVSASAAVPLQSGVAGAGMVAATLLWAVTAGLVRSAVLRPGRRR